MKPFLDDVLSSARVTTASFNIKAIATIAFIAVILFIAIYAMTVNPNDASATIGFPP
jgi:uncharacterized protein involved in outer membrane biogenesis